MFMLLILLVPYLLFALPAQAFFLIPPTHIRKFSQWIIPVYTIVHFAQEIRYAIYELHHDPDPLIAPGWIVYFAALILSECALWLITHHLHLCKD